MLGLRLINGEGVEEGGFSADAKPFEIRRRADDKAAKEMTNNVGGVRRICPRVRIVDAVRSGAAGGRVGALAVNPGALQNEFIFEGFRVIGVPSVFHDHV